MANEFGSDFISITDEDGNEFELELLDALVHNDIYYHAFVPATEGDDEEEVEIIILKAVEEDGEELLTTLDSEEELQTVYDLFLERLFDEDETE